MCGIFGVSLEKAQLRKEQKAILAAVLAIGNDNRGGDSWGFYDFKKVDRGLGDLAAQAIKLVNKNLFMAHTRKATTGSVSVENCHPFEIGKIVGAHNGIISNHITLNSKYERNFNVDSMHLFAHLDQDLDFGEISGYGTIEWTDRSENNRRVYLCKMSSGDLSVWGIGENAKNCKGIIWSSDNDHVKAAIAAANIRAFEFKIETGQVYFVENCMLYEANRKLAINKDDSRSWRNGYSSYAGYAGYTGSDTNWRERWEHMSPWSMDDDNDKEVTVVNKTPSVESNEDSELDRFIASWKNEENERVKNIEKLDQEISKPKGGAEVIQLTTNGTMVTKG